MNLQQIKDAIAQGKTVHWSNLEYIVTKDKHGEYYIQYTPNGHCIGLTHQDGVTMNGKEEEFFLKAWSRYDITKAVDEGKTVHYSNDSYTVAKDAKGSYQIEYNGTDRSNWWGLSGKDHSGWDTLNGESLNGDPTLFYIKG